MYNNTPPAPRSPEPSANTSKRISTTEAKALTAHRKRAAAPQDPQKKKKKKKKGSARPKPKPRKRGGVGSFCCEKKDPAPTQPEASGKQIQGHVSTYALERGSRRPAAATKPRIIYKYRDRARARARKTCHCRPSP